MNKDKNGLRRKNKNTAILKTGRFNNIDPVVIISRLVCGALFTHLMMTAESMLFKRPVERIKVALFSLKLFFLFKIARKTTHWLSY